MSLGCCFTLEGGEQMEGGCWGARVLGWGGGGTGVCDSDTSGRKRGVISKTLYLLPFTQKNTKNFQ